MLIKGNSNETQYCYWCNKLILKGDEIVIDILADELVCCSEKCYDIHENYINRLVECAEEKINLMKENQKILNKKC